MNFNPIFLLLVTLFSSHLMAQNQVSSWTYVEVDNEKPRWGDYDKPNWLRYFGLDMGDLNNDGKADIISGRTIYLNPGEKPSGNWQKVDLGDNLDGILVMNVDNDQYADIIAQALPGVYWLEATDRKGKSWKSTKIAEVPATSHVNSQGFEKAQIIEGGQQEILIAGNGNIYSIEIPENPEENHWNTTLVAANTSDEGIGIGDLDGDGDMDIAAGRRPEAGDEPLIIVWYENPGDGSANWKDRELGKTNHPADRIEVADLNGDDKADIVVSEERYPGLEPDGNLFWYEQPIEKDGKWQRHWIVTQYSMNNLDIVDMDKDGDIDILTCEHKGPRLELQLWVNNGSGDFSKEVLDKGKENHLGNQVADIDGDGDMDIVGIGWDKYQFVHLWINEN